MNASWRLGRIGSMVVTVNYTWLLVGAGGLWVLALLQFGPPSGGAPGWVPWALACGVVLLYTVGLLLAEAIRTRLVGRFSPSWPRGIHLFPFGAVLPYPPDRVAPSRAAVVSLIGPVVLGLLGAGYWGIAEVLAGPSLGLPDVVLRALAWVHFGGALLNLLPGLPLAGGWLVVAFLKAWGRDIPGAVRLGHRLGLVLVIVGLAAGVQAIIAQGNWLVGMSLIILAWTIREGSAAIEQHVLAEEMLGQLTAGEVMESAPLSVSPANTLGDVFWHRGKINPDQVLPVQDQGAFVGLLPLSLSEETLQGTWPRVAVGTAMVPAARLPTVAADAPLPTVLAAFGQEQQMVALAEPPPDAVETAHPGLGFVPVIENHTLRGLVAWDQVEEYEHLAADAGVQEAAALEAATIPARSPAAWLRGALALGVGVMLLAAFGTQVVGPTLVPEPTATPVPSTVITFSEQTPPDGSLLPAGETLIKLGIHSTVSIEKVTITLDNEPLPTTLDLPGATDVIASATTTINLLGPHTVRLELQTGTGVTSQTEWTFQVVSSATP